jgi:catechol 2,3-dioxygenase-like lactoylglutathione lyase family enzyme
MKISRFLHTTILIADRDRAEQFYSKILGLPAAERNLTFPGIWYQLGEWQLHLIETPNYAMELNNSEKWGRNPHIALAVNDLATMKAKLEAAGCPLQNSASGRPAMFTRDPDGNVIELTEIIDLE